MDDVPTILIAGSAASLLLIALLRALGMRYCFSGQTLTVRGYGLLPLQTLPFDRVRLEAVGKRGEELPRLREREPDKKIVDLTRSVLSRWTVCGFVSTPDAIHILPHPVARAVISRNPPARWALTRLETRLRLSRLPHQILEAWPNWLRIGTPTAAGILLLGGLCQTTYTLGAIAMLTGNIPLPKRWVAELAFCHLIQPLLGALCGAWLLGSALMKKHPSLLIRTLALFSCLGGFILCEMGSGIHDMSHLVGEDCDSYPSAIREFLVIGTCCSGAMLIKPLLTRIFGFPSFQMEGQMERTGENGPHGGLTENYR